MGTSAHSFTLLHDTEKEAFEAQIASMGPDTTLLVDTYDIPKAVQMAVELTGGEVAAVRIDSGDLGSTAVEVRAQLDQLGAKKTKIVVTSDLDEYTIAALSSSPVDRYGVGTSLVTGSGHPTAGFVYKLVAHSDGDGWSEVAKTSKSKTNRGGAKIASRLIESGVATAELVGSDKGRRLQVELMSSGLSNEQYLGPSGVLLAKDHHLMAKLELPRSALRLSKGDAAIPTVFS